MKRGNMKTKTDVIVLASCFMFHVSDFNLRRGHDLRGLGGTGELRQLDLRRLPPRVLKAAAARGRAAEVSDQAQAGAVDRAGDGDVTPLGLVEDGFEGEHAVERRGGVA